MFKNSLFGELWVGLIVMIIAFIIIAVVWNIFNESPSTSLTPEMPPVPSPPSRQEEANTVFKGIILSTATENLLQAREGFKAGVQNLESYWNQIILNSQNIVDMAKSASQLNDYQNAYIMGYAKASISGANAIIMNTQSEDLKAIARGIIRRSERIFTFSK